MSLQSVKKWLSTLTDTPLLKTKLTLTRLDIALLVLGLLVFAMLALATIGDSSIWFDEAFSAYIIQFNFVEIWQYTAVDVHPPLYYWLLKVWSWLFGTTELGLRSMSVLFGGIAITFGYLLTHRLFGRQVALYSLAALVISPMVIRYSQEMRMYTMVAAIALAATYVLVRATETGKRKLWVLYGVLVSLGMWTHYFAAIVWLAHWAWRGWVLSRQARKQLWQRFFSNNWVVAHVVAVGLFVPWLPAFFMQLINVQANGFWIPPVGPATLTNYFTNTLIYLDESAMTPWVTLGFLVLIALLIALGVRGYRMLSRTGKIGYGLLLILAFVPPALLIITSMPPLQSSFVDRYLVPSMFALSLLIGVTASFAWRLVKPKWLAAAAVALVAGALVFGVSNVYHYGNHNKINNSTSGAKQVMAQIWDEAEPGEPIVAASVWMYYDAVFYTTEDNPVFFIEPDDYPYGSLAMLRTQSRNKIIDIAEFAKQHETFWYVGQPGANELSHPLDGLEVVQTLRQADPTTGKPVYQAIQFRTTVE